MPLRPSERSQPCQVASRIAGLRACAGYQVERGGLRVEVTGAVVQVHPLSSGNGAGGAADGKSVFEDRLAFRDRMQRNFVSRTNGVCGSDSSSLAFAGDADLSRVGNIGEQGRDVVIGLDLK